MFQITYKSFLKENKNLSDYKAWLREAWPVYQEWGAVSFEIWTDPARNENIVYCKYIIRDLRRWNRMAMKNNTAPLVHALNDVIDGQRIGITIRADCPDKPMNQ